jgi:TolB protein
MLQYLRSLSGILLSLFLSVSAAAQITGTVTDETGSDEFVIAIPPFATPANAPSPAGSTAELGDKIAGIIANNLNATDVFRPVGPRGLPEITMGEVTAPAFPKWEARNAENLVQGYVRLNGDGTLTVGCYLYDVALQSEMIRQGYTVNPRDWRRAAHKCADAIYSRLSGENPFFDSRIVYIAESGPKGKRIKRLAVMDSDGANHRFLTNGQSIALTPRYSPDYRSILYLSYLDKRPRIYIYDLASNSQRLVYESANQTFAPRWSLDGRTILFSMEVGGNIDIFKVSASGGTPQRLTNAPGIDTGGSFSPDGNRIVFESDRSGSQQLYVMDADGSNAQRISFGGGSYATPEWSPRGDLVAFTRIGGGQFRIGVMTPAGANERLLTSSWQDEAPTWSPNGRIIQFFRSERGSRGGTSVWQVDVTGARERRIETPVDGSDPSWGPILP